MDDLTNNVWNFTEHRDDYLPTPPPCPPSPDCPCPPPRPLPPMPPMPGCPPRPCPPDPCQNRTPNYGLPLWKASDVTSWLMQMNGAMLRIDNIMHDLALRTGINGLPDDLVTTVSKLCQDVAVLNCTVGELSNKQANQDLLMQNMNTQFSAMKTDIASLQLSITNLDTRVMTVDSANQQNRNDITLIKSDLNMLSKTVTNLSSNLTQFQNATNQTLATLQTSVDGIEDFLDNPPIKSLNKDFSDDSKYTQFDTTTGAALNTIGTKVANSATHIRINKVFGKFCSIFFSLRAGIILNMETIPTSRTYGLKIDVEDLEIMGKIYPVYGNMNIGILNSSGVNTRVVNVPYRLTGDYDSNAGILKSLNLYINYGYNSLELSDVVTGSGVLLDELVFMEVLVMNNSFNTLEADVEDEIVETYKGDN